MFKPTPKEKKKSEQDALDSRRNSSSVGLVNPTPVVRQTDASIARAASQQQQQRQVLSQATQQAVTELNDIRERRNWLIHQLYTRQEFINCLAVIEAQLRDTEGTCEYALYVKGLLKRMEGHLTESLSLLQAAVLVSPENTETRKQFGRALFLLGRHEEALEAFRESQTLAMARGQNDWEVELHLGLCLVFLGDLDGAVNAFVRSIGLQRIDSTFLHLGRTLVKMKSYDSAIQIYQEALTVSPHNPDLQAALGQLYLKTGAVQQAFSCFGACLTEDPTHLKALVGASSIIQTNGDFDVALLKYRVAVSKAPDSAQLWNNIGVCFFGKQAHELRLGSASVESTSGHNLYAAVACLRKSILLAPFEWITNYNLGLVFLALGRYVSAFHYLSASITLNSKYAPSFMFLGVCLSLMNDIDNACHAYEKALSMEDDLLFHVNYAVTLLNSNLLPESAAQLQMILPVWQNLTPEQRRETSPLLPTTVAMLQKRLAGVQPGRTILEEGGASVRREEAGLSTGAMVQVPTAQADANNGAAPQSSENGCKPLPAELQSSQRAGSPHATAMSSVPVLRAEVERHAAGFDENLSGGPGNVVGGAGPRGESSTLNVMRSASTTLASTSVSEEASQASPPRRRDSGSQNPNEDDYDVNEAAGAGQELL